VPVLSSVATSATIIIVDVLHCELCNNVALRVVGVSVSVSNLILHCILPVDLSSVPCVYSKLEGDQTEEKRAIFKLRKRRKYPNELLLRGKRNYLKQIIVVK